MVVVMLFAVVAVLTGCNDNLETRIRQTALEYHQSQGGWRHVRLRHVRISTYGYFSGAVPFSMWHVADGDWPLGAEPWHETVSGIEFSRHSYAPIVIWHDDRIFSITDAFYKYELLTVEHLIKIQELVNW